MIRNSIFARRIRELKICVSDMEFDIYGLELCIKRSEILFLTIWNSKFYSLNIGIRMPAYLLRIPISGYPELLLAGKFKSNLIRLKEAADGFVPQAVCIFIHCKAFH